MEKIKNYINGNLVEPKSGNYFDNVSPVTGEVYSMIPDSDINDINHADLGPFLMLILYQFLHSFIRINSFNIFLNMY